MARLLSNLNWSLKEYTMGTVSVSCTIMQTSDCLTQRNLRVPLQKPNKTCLSEESTLTIRIERLNRESKTSLKVHILHCFMWLIDGRKLQSHLCGLPLWRTMWTSRTPCALGLLPSERRVGTSYLINTMVLRPPDCLERKWRPISITSTHSVRHFTSCKISFMINSPIISGLIDIGSASSCVTTLIIPTAFHLSWIPNPGTCPPNFIAYMTKI